MVVGFGMFLDWEAEYPPVDMQKYVLLEYYVDHLSTKTLFWVLVLNYLFVIQLWFLEISYALERLESSPPVYESQCVHVRVNK